MTVVPLRSRSLTVGALGLALGTAAVAFGLPATASAASATTCRTALSASLSTHDPTTLQDHAVATVRLQHAARATGVRVTVLRGTRRVATGSAVGTIRTGSAPVDLKLARTPAAGRLTVRATGRVAGCGTVSGRSSWTLRAASLPVRAALRGTTTVDGRSVVRVLLRSVGGLRSTGVRVALLNAAGKRVASASVPGTLTGLDDVALQASGVLPAGRYRAVVTGRSSGAARTATQALVLSAASTDASAASATPSRQKAVVDWSGGSSTGRDTAGFVLPGIGHGEVVCSSDTQWLRIFPTDLSRETSLMNWTYRQWDGNAANTEKALREGLHTTGTGRDFAEGFNKFQPAEKRSTGEFIALLTDRGSISAPAPGDLAAPIGVHVTWAWDFTDPSKARCHVEAEVVAQTAGATGIGSAQVVWRGDGAAAGHDTASADVPGVGHVTVVCQAGPSGTRQVTLDGAGGGTVITRQGSEDASVPQSAGPIVAELPNNGQVEIDVPAGKLLISSRWKVNDPDASQNRCSVAAQGVAN